MNSCTSPSTARRFSTHRPLFLAPLLLFSLLVLSACDGTDPLMPDMAIERVSEEPQNGGAASAGGREPSGYATITDRPFSDLGDAGWSYNESPHFSVVTDESTPGSCCSAAEARFPRGWKGGKSPMVTWHDVPNTNEIYISFHIKLSENWQGHESGVNKLGFIWIHDDASVYFSAQGSGNGTLRPRIRLQAVPDGARNLEPNVSDASVNRGEWHRWEIQLIANTPGTANGVARIWLDGQLISEHHDILYSGASQDNVWQQVYWYPVWGGMQDAVRDDMTLRISDYYASGR